MKNIDIRPDEEEMMGAVIGLNDVLRQVEACDHNKAVALRASVMEWLAKKRQSIWDGLPDRFRREVGKGAPPAKDRPGPSQAAPSKT